jgi:TonB family protein
MKTPRLILVALVLLARNPASAAEVEAWIERNEGGRAVTISGKVIVAKRGQRPPWQNDCVKAVSPEYSRWERSQRHQGVGMFRMLLDPTTGAVTRVEVAKSTGFKGLDNDVVRSLHQWRWKPGKWKEIDIPTTFSIAKPLPPIPAGATQLPLSR